MEVHIRRVNDLIDHVDKQTVVHNANSLLQGSGSCTDVGNGSIKRKVDDIISIVRHCRRLAWLRLVVGAVPEAEGGLAARELGEGSDEAHRVLVAEWHDLDGERKRRAEALAKLRVVNDTDKLLGANLHHLLAQQRSPPTLDESHAGIHCIGPVNRNIQRALLVQSAKRDLQALSLLPGALRSRDANNVLEFARGKLLPDPLHGKVGCRASPEPNNHPARDVVVHGLVPAAGKRASGIAPASRIPHPPAPLTHTLGSHRNLLLLPAESPISHTARVGMHKLPVAPSSCPKSDRKRPHDEFCIPRTRIRFSSAVASSPCELLCLGSHCQTPRI